MKVFTQQSKSIPPEQASGKEMKKMVVERNTSSGVRSVRTGKDISTSPICLTRVQSYPVCNYESLLYSHIVSDVIP